ncbi:MAG: phosphate acyltransferase PlsX [Christensenellales bacterium]
MKRVVVDAFGGDNAPVDIIAGCAMALSEISDLYLILTGDEERIEQELKKHTGIDRNRVEVRHAPDVITNNEHPVNAVRRKKESSLVKALEAVANKDADVFVSAGSTGAVLAGATFIVRRIKGIKRPALAPVLPTKKDHDVILIDCGANVDMKPANLQQFAVMGAAYAERIMGIKNPRVGLLNNGAEAEKGCELTKEAYKLLQETPVNFTGNCEGRDILSGDFDVVVSDGFAGNVALKTIEGTAMMVMSVMKRELMGGIASRIGALLARGAFKRIKAKMDYSSHGGALLLGIDGGIIKAHGSSDAKAFAAALHQAVKFIDGDVVNIIRQSIESMAMPEES